MTFASNATAMTKPPDGLSYVLFSKEGPLVPVSRTQLSLGQEISAGEESPQLFSGVEETTYGTRQV